MCDIVCKRTIRQSPESAMARSTTPVLGNRRHIGKGAILARLEELCDSSTTLVSVTPRYLPYSPAHSSGGSCLIPHLKVTPTNLLPYPQSLFSTIVYLIVMLSRI